MIYCGAVLPLSICGDHRPMSWVGSPTFPFVMLAISQNQCQVGDCFSEIVELQTVNDGPSSQIVSAFQREVSPPSKPGKRVQNSRSNGQMYIYASSEYTTKRRASASLVHLKRGPDSTNSQKRLRFPQAFQISSSATSCT